MILMLEDLIVGSVIVRRSVYVNTDKVYYVKVTGKRILFNFGWYNKCFVSSNFNLKQLKKWDRCFAW